MLSLVLDLLRAFIVTSVLSYAFSSQQFLFLLKWARLIMHSYINSPKCVVDLYLVQLALDIRTCTYTYVRIIIIIMYYNINYVIYCSAGKPRPPSSVHIVCARIYSVYNNISRIILIIMLTTITKHR